MSAIDWEHAPETAKPTYEELEAMCWELTEQNAELREHVRMPDEPLEIDEKDFYVRAFIKWATEEQPEVKRLEAENAKLRELVRDMYKSMDMSCQFSHAIPPSTMAHIKNRAIGLGVDA